MSVVQKTKMLGSGIASAFACQLLAPAVALAEEEAKEGVALILPDPIEFVPMLVAFIILWIILAKFGWPVFDRMLQKRQDTIQADLQRAEEARIEGERVLAEYKQELDAAKAQASQIVADAKKTGEAARADIAAAAQKEASDMIEKARVAIEAEKKAAIAELQSSVADTSISVVGRLVGTDLTDDEHRAIIERYVQEAGSFNGN